MTEPLSAEEKERRKQARKLQKAEPPAAKPEKKTPSKVEVIQPLAVEITFPAIMDLKQALAFDTDGNLVIGIQFKAKVDQYEIFRLVNLLKQPHGTLFATIGSPQSAMDFKFDMKSDKVEVIKAAKTIPQVPAKTADKPHETAEPLFPEPAVTKIHAVTFNHIPEEKQPYGVAIDYIADGTGEIHTAAGRGKNPTEAVMAGVVKILPDGVKEPFEAMAALEQMEPSPEGYKLIRAIQVGSFEESETGKGESETEKGE